MKIDPGVPPPSPPQASGSRRQLSREATFDRTMEQMESRMWPGAKVGSQPTTRLPAAQPTMFSDAALAPMALAGATRMSGPTAAMPTVSFAARPYAVGPSIVEAAASHADASRNGTTRVASIAIAGPRPVASFTEEDDVAIVRRGATPPRDEPTDDESTHLITWAESPNGAELTIRQPLRHGHASAFAREALAQIRRHGLLPRRVTVNGVTAEHSHRHGDSA